MMRRRSASELGQKYATQNYPSQGTPICKLHGPSKKLLQCGSAVYGKVDEIFPAPPSSTPLPLPPSPLLCPNPPQPDPPMAGPPSLWKV